MAAVIEIKYFNSFVLNKTNVSDEPLWNGSRGIPNDIGGYPVATGSTTDADNWTIEESRIRGGYNNTSTDYGARAYLVEEDPSASFRIASMIYSGIFNSRTGINNSNVFSVAEEITKSVNPIQGSIQKLYAENSNLIIFQEEKVSRALIDKDAIYSAEGGGSITNANLVIGTVQPYLGEYGISKNPESFAVYGYDKYFSDKNNNAILRLTNNGIIEISAYGMKDFFRDQLNSIDTASSRGLVLGGYDVHSSEYTVSLQKNPVLQSGEPFNTLSFDPKVNGWPTFFTYKPEQMFSIQNRFYTVKSGGLYRHYASQTGTGTVVNRNTFYGIESRSSLSFVVNQNPAASKTFQAVSYEGNSGWQLDTFTSDFTGKVRDPEGSGFIKTFDVVTPAPPATGPAIKSYYEGEYVIVYQKAITNESSTNTSVVLSSYAPSTTPPIVGAIVSGAGVADNTKVVSFNIASNTLTVDQNLNVTKFQTLNLSIVVDRSGYVATFGNANPPYPKYYCGFVIKENKYVANLINTSVASEKEIIFGESISGIKGFYSNVTLSTDKTTDPGGEKQLFNVSTTYTSNNGY